MQKKHAKNEDIDWKRFLAASVVIGHCALVMVLVICLRSGASSLDEMNKTIPKIFVYFGICEFSLMITCAFTFGILRCLNSRAFNFAVHRIANGWSQRQLQQQAELIYCDLLVFVYDVIRKNNQTLCLPISDDEFCLMAKGSHVRWYNGQAVFRFELALNEKPNLSAKRLRSCLMRAIHQYFKGKRCSPNIIVSDSFFDVRNLIWVFELKFVTPTEYMTFVKNKES